MKAVLYTVAVVALIALAWPALAHDEFAWVAKYTNAHGTNCCGQRDTTVISDEQALNARIGSTIVADFPGVANFPVIVQVIRQTEDEHGRPVLSKFGCLFSQARF